MQKRFKILEQAASDRIAFCTDQRQITISKLEYQVNELDKKVSGARLAILLCDNSREALLSYIYCIQRNVVPLLLSASISDEKLRKYINDYRPEILFKPCHIIFALDEDLSCTLFGIDIFMLNDNRDFEIHNELAVLLATSGSTGDGQVVRISHQNLIANTDAIIEYLKLGPEDSTILQLPIHYSYGLSILHTHLVAQGCLHLPGKGLDLGISKLLAARSITNFNGVNASYQILARLKFLENNWPSLRFFTHAGGRPDSRTLTLLHKQATDFNKDVFLMYGQTEASPRIAYLAPELFRENIDNGNSVGMAIPGGQLTIMDETGIETSSRKILGEIIYRGANVAMGYAINYQNLADGDKWRGRLETGDIGMLSDRNLLQIKGRKKRFVKINGIRLNLDQIEKDVARIIDGAELAAVGTDEMITLFVCGINIEDSERVKREICCTFTILLTQIEIICLRELPKNLNGKVDFEMLKRHIRDR